MRKLCPASGQQCENDCVLPGVCAPKPFEGEPTKCPTFVWLIEARFFGGGRLMYWAGRSNRVGKDPRGVEVTVKPEDARRIPLDSEDLAVDIAAALNQAYPVRREDEGLPWAAVQHGFIG